MDKEWVEIEEDGVVHLYDPDTGEYVGPKSRWLAPEITGEADALAVMRALAENKARMIAIQRKYDLLLKQQERELKRLQSKETWLTTTYVNQLGRFAEETLPRRANGELRVKTLVLPWGNIAIRESKEKVVVTHEESAVHWCEDHCPEAVKLKKSILVSQLTDEVKEMISEKPGEMSFHGFSVLPAEKKFVISTVEDDQ
mgnify:CR=1 FL=1